MENSKLKNALGPYAPHFARRMAKKLYWTMVRKYSQHAYIKKSGYVEFGYRFRFARRHPYIARVGAETITERLNVWNAKSGDIVIGDKCWIGLNNIIMGPIEIGNSVTTGPNVTILGPRHPALDKTALSKDKTTIGNNVWISTGSIIVFGVTIQDGAIVGPGSIVSKDVAAGAFVSGNPARDLTKMVGKLWNMDTLQQERFRARSG